MKYIKNDETTLRVVKTTEAKTEENNYDLNFLKQQEVAILKQKNDFVEARDRELEEVRNLITQAEKLGIKPKKEFDAEKESSDEEINTEEELEKSESELEKLKKEEAKLEKDLAKKEIEANISDVVSKLEINSEDVEELIN